MKQRSLLGRTEIPMWYDTKVLKEVPAAKAVFERAAHMGYTGFVLYPDNYEKLKANLPGQCQVAIRIDSEQLLNDVMKGDKLANLFTKGQQLIIMSSSHAVLQKASKKKLNTCFHCHVVDADTLHESIEQGKAYDYLTILFKDPTNIPLELVIASLQKTGTILMKEIKNTEDVDDAIVSLGVMEVGADGVIFSPKTHTVLDGFFEKLENVYQKNKVGIGEATIVQTQAVGMGYRACIDLATMFSENEGMIVGSTSQGGILCCPEVFYLPYMELRPFRINAGGVHSYVYNANNLTDYISELKAGSQVMISDLSGNIRLAPVGRIKTEVRPMRLIEAKFDSGEHINIIMQDDWHVRVFGADGKPNNITELKPGDKVLGYLTEVGRHVGIKVEEHIMEC